MIDPYALLEPLSYIKAIPNEYNGGQGLAKKEVGFVATGVAYDDILENSFQAWAPHYAKSAGYGEWSTGGTLTFKAVAIWVDNAGVQQVTTLVAKDGGTSATANPFEDAMLFGPAVLPKVGSRWFIHGKCVYSVAGYFSHARADYANGEALQYGDPGSIPDPSATPYTNTYTANGDYFGPSFVGGKLARATARVSGDSNVSGVLSNGIADVPDTLTGGIGALNRLLTPNIAVLDVSIPGGTAQENADPAKNVCTDRLMKLGKANKKRVYAVGFNDTLNAGRTSAQVAADIATQAARHGGGDIYLPTLTPKVTSAASNTVPNATAETQRQAENTRRRALPAQVIDLALGVEQGTTGTMQRIAETTDGSHLNTAGAKSSATGSGFDVAAKMGTPAINAGFKYPSGAIYQSLTFADSWNASNIKTFSSADAYSPEHRVNAGILAEDTSASDHQLFKQITATLAAGSYALTIFAKRKVGVRNFRPALVRSDFGASALAAFNLGTGAPILTGNPSGPFTAISASASAVDDYWKCVMNFTINATLTNPYIQLFTADATGNQGYAGDNSSSLNIWGLDVR